MHRFRWKGKEENSGRLHTVQLAALSVHPNYFGDLFAYTGLALVAGNRCALSMSPVMVWSFDYLTIPNLDKYLAERYGPEEFGAYAARTEVLVPFLPRAARHVLSWVGFAASVYLGGFCGSAFSWPGHVKQ